jgi:hypothetical protein
MAGLLGAAWLGVQAGIRADGEEAQATGLAKIAVAARGCAAGARILMSEVAGLVALAPYGFRTSLLYKCACACICTFGCHVIHVNLVLCNSQDGESAVFYILPGL